MCRPLNLLGLWLWVLGFVADSEASLAGAGLAVGCMRALGNLVVLGRVVC